jgi:glucokinase
MFYQDSGGEGFTSACFAVAGPVEDNRCQMTNLKWNIDGEALSVTFNLPIVSVINDFAAVGYGITGLAETDTLSLNTVLPKQNGPIAVVGPGTGLGEAFMLWNNSLCQYDIVCTEASHSPFAPKDSTQIKLLEYMWTKYEVCEVEHVCSGPGLKRIYEFVCLESGRKVDEIEPAEITDRALRKTCQLCISTLTLFLSILGSECASAGLRVLATGGVYIAGGIPLKILPRILEDDCVHSNFKNHNSSMNSLVAKFPLKVVTHPQVGLLGAKLIATRQLSE